MIGLFDNIVIGVISCLALVIFSYIIFSFKKLIVQLISFYRRRKLIQNNIIPIVHNNENSYRFFGISESDSMISIKSHMDFIKMYDKMDKDKDINVVIHTLGGALSSAEAICNCILNHTGKGKIVCYVPFYSYSGGCLIALCCDKIVMRQNSVLGPCDAQKPVGALSIHSVASIINTVNYKKTNKEKITEEWLASSFDATLCKDRQRSFIDKLIKYKKYSKEQGDVIYEEFFSGKYNHDKIFSAQDSKEIVNNVEINNNTPINILNLINT